MAILLLCAVALIIVLVILAVASQRRMNEMERRQQCEDCRVRELIRRMMSYQDWPEHERQELIRLCASDQTRLELCA